MRACNRPATQVLSARRRMDGRKQVIEDNGVTQMVAICAICKSQFTKVLPYYKHPMDMIGSVHGLVSRAIVLTPKP